MVTSTAADDERNPRPQSTPTPTSTPVPVSPEAAAKSAAEPAQSGTTHPGTTYRTNGRPGLTTPGVAVLSTGVGLVFGVLSSVVTGGIGWLFAVPFVLVSGYCAWEVRPSDRRAVVIAPPLTLLVVAAVDTVLDHGFGGLRQLASGVVTVLASAAPILVAALGISVAVLVVRRLRQH